MSSGEAEVVSVKISDLTTPPIGDWPNSNFSYWWSDNTTNTNGYTYTYSTYKYMYQITCPKCNTLNWCELEQVIECSGKVGRKSCNARLKATKQVVDFEVPVK